MLDYFAFDEKVENVTEYLTRMAGVMDSIQNDVEYEGINYKRMLAHDEQVAIRMYVIDFIIKDVINTAEGIAAERHLGALTDDFVTETVIEVLTNFHKFNNPRFKKVGDNEENKLNKLSVFVKIYMSAIKYDDILCISDITFSFISGLAFSHALTDSAP